MFKVEHNVPDVYINYSRDFQLFARLYDLVFQSSRFSIDSMQYATDTMRCNDTILPLIATKVGFFTDLKLTSYADRLILSAFPYIIKYKGSFNGIKLVTNLFERIMNTKVDSQQDEEDPNHVTIIFDEYTPNLELLYSLLDYVRPAGLLIDYIVRSELSFTADYEMDDKVKIVELDPTNALVETVSNIGYESEVGFTELSRVDVEDNN